MSNPQSWNRYSYVKNRPIKFNDPTGHWEDQGCGTGGAGGRTGCNLPPPPSGGNNWCALNPWACSSSLHTGSSGTGKPTITVPENIPCAGLLNCEPSKPTKEEFIEELIPVDSAEVCQFLQLQPYMCDFSLWQSLPSSISVPSFAPTLALVEMYCGGISGLACAANLSQDIAMVVDMVGVGLIEVPAVIGGCFEGGPLGCAIGEGGAALTWNLSPLNGAETAASGLSLVLTALDEWGSPGGLGENTATSAVSFVSGLWPFPPSWDLAVDTYGSGYGHGVFNGISSIWTEGLLK